MEQIVILKKETFDFLQKTIDQCRDWLDTDAIYSHSKSNVRVVQTNVINLVRMMNADLDHYRDNRQMLERVLNTLNTSKVDVSSNHMLGGDQLRTCTIEPSASGFKITFLVDKVVIREVVYPRWSKASKDVQRWMEGL